MGCPRLPSLSLPKRDNRLPSSFQEPFMQTQAKKCITPHSVLNTPCFFPLERHPRGRHQELARIIPLTGCFITSFQPPADRHLGCFLSFAKTDSTSVQSCVQTTWTYPCVEPGPGGGCVRVEGVKCDLWWAQPPQTGRLSVASCHYTESFCQMGCYC